MQTILLSADLYVQDIELQKPTSSHSLEVELSLILDSNCRHETNTSTCIEVAHKEQLSYKCDKVLALKLLNSINLELKN